MFYSYSIICILCCNTLEIAMNDSEILVTDTDVAILGWIVLIVIVVFRVIVDIFNSAMDYNATHDEEVIEDILDKSNYN